MYKELLPILDLKLRLKDIAFFKPKKIIKTYGPVKEGIIFIKLVIDIHFNNNQSNKMFHQSNKKNLFNKDNGYSKGDETERKNRYIYAKYNNI